MALVLLGLSTGVVAVALPWWEMAAWVLVPLGLARATSALRPGKGNAAAGAGLVVGLVLVTASGWAVPAAWLAVNGEQVRCALVDRTAVSTNGQGGRNRYEHHFDCAGERVRYDVARTGHVAEVGETRDLVLDPARRVPPRLGPVSRFPVLVLLLLCAGAAAFVVLVAAAKREPAPPKPLTPDDGFL
ncbi:hypothetical protein CKY47_24310 [Saccharothrix yanglingensis]|uniref:DUF3592 domain-containing protein n=1 Tax=Saccharothrix yanglingensis TaxID=659496 RepID=A0ABU0X4K8_9PSEU|nr:hypothetical protein [Saccharothrix yanglingensis]